MSRIGRLVVIAVVSSAAVATGTGLPPEVADRLERAISFDDTDDFVGSYRISISSVVQKPNGKSRKESLIEADVVNHSNGTRQRHLLKYIEDGSDFTDKKRAEFESEVGGRQNGDGDEDLADPFGDTAGHYRFSTPEIQGSTVVMSFEPAPGHEDDHDIARGTIVWDEASREPQSLEMVAVHPPKPLKELQLKMEFEMIHDDLFMARLVTDGLAKVLLLKREFHMEIRFDNIRPDKKNVDDKAP